MGLFKLFQYELKPESLLSDFQKLSVHITLNFGSSNERLPQSVAAVKSYSF
ncbi:Hypothetical protein VS_1258 [Vibrio atlanticus]|uniref:Uncharacterized protein n=1 Tax=Vibrio atlanticus (strain LGP32) TaxID=575788 RepID=B7VN47_VIBA3|nr:Hypothetical protein VS_1258 [Vibrio atlanticus]